MAAIGLLGGSFNPAHYGHIAISEHACKELDLDEIWWVISPLNPLKESEKLANISQRISFAQNITKPDFIKVKLLEPLKQKSYSINLINHLQKKYKEHNFIWLMGADNLANFTSWYNYEKIIQTINIAIFPRNNYLNSPNIFNEKYKNNFINNVNIKKLKMAKPPAWSIIPMTLINISATEIRNGNN